ncbi:DUF6266 family protein [Pedobacter hartonius]|uniref:Uncharacterized protein n=1 Tax=Pedobacter hartonius TaxID=425514 RepID=A0A1H4BUP3_9SPHI|nr:DUF6266 family protein [Pedobacter hartonius]SEA51895.1 hypothetical protein SAMN05443550_103476 [Pedobacter hartonius]
MAIVKPGIVGNFNGKIGEVVLSRWKDVNVGKSTPRKSTKLASLNQLDQRLRFGLVTKFFRGLSKVISIGFQNESTNQTKMNAAVKYHLDNAVTGMYPDYALDYTKVIFSDPNPISNISTGITTTVVSQADATFKVSWLNIDRAYGNTLPTDLAHFVFYSITRKKYILYSGAARRSDLTYSVEFPRIFTGDTIQGYLFFVSEDGKSVSYTDNLGQNKLLP